MSAAGFRHEAFLYQSDIEFIEVVAEFISAGVEEGASTLIVVDADKLARLRRVATPWHRRRPPPTSRRSWTWARSGGSSANG
jgi:hypothetical protein